MHMENRYTDEFPSGDVAGNKFMIPNHYECDELHALWDKVLYTQHKNIARPFTDATYADF